MSKFFKALVKEMKDENISIAADGTSSAEFSGYIDTGSYALNALLSGSINNGLPDNKVLGLAGDPATGKTFFGLGIVRNFLERNKDAGGVIFDTESATTKDMMVKRNVDADRIIIAEPITVQQFKTNALQLLVSYEKSEDRPPMIYMLDSLGGLSTTKEIADSTAGDETKDMTRAQLIKGAFRVLRLKLARVRVPLIVTNHIYASMSQYEEKQMGGGSGLKYAADYIAVLTKSKLKDDEKKVVGNIITVKLTKSRLTKEQSSVEVCLRYDTGLDRYYGLFDIAEKHNVFTRTGKTWNIGKKTAGSRDEVNANPTEFYTKDVLAQIDEVCKKEFLYGQ